MEGSEIFQTVINGIEGVSRLVGSISQKNKKNDFGEELQKLTELTGTILKNSLQMVRYESELRARVRSLEEEMKNIKNWEKEKKRYELRNTTRRGATAYALKLSAKPKEVEHVLCTRCFEDGKKRILQPSLDPLQGNVWLCSDCGQKIPGLGLS